MELSMQTLPPVMTAQEVAELLRCSVATVDRYVANHQLAAIRMGRFRRFRADDVLDFIGSRPVTARCSQTHFRRARPTERNVPETSRKVS
jgi:excisionase family DNA binding protein